MQGRWDSARIVRGRPRGGYRKPYPAVHLTGEAIQMAPTVLCSYFYYYLCFGGGEWENQLHWQRLTKLSTRWCTSHLFHLPGTWWKVFLPEPQHYLSCPWFDVALFYLLDKTVWEKHSVAQSLSIFVTEWDSVSLFSPEARISGCE